MFTKSAASILGVLLFSSALSGCTSIVQGLARAYIDGSPVSDYAYIHPEAKVGDSAYYIDLNSKLEMPSRIMAMSIAGVKEGTFHIVYVNTPAEPIKGAVNNYMFSQMPEMVSHTFVNNEHKVLKSHLAIADDLMHFNIVTPGPGQPILSRKVTILDQPQLHRIGSHTYSVDRLVVEHWRLEEDNTEWLLVKHMSPDVPFGIVQWELTGSAEIDMKIEGTLVSTLELALALYNPKSAYDTLQKALGVVEDKTLLVPVQQKWVYYPSMEQAREGITQVKDKLREQQKQLDAKKSLIQKLFE